MRTNRSNISVRLSDRAGLSLVLANASAATTIFVLMAQSAEAAQYAPAVAALPPCTAANGCPPAVPSEYVGTPSGWFHPSCIVPVGKDEEVDMLAHTIVKSDGSSSRPVPPCSYLPRDPQGNTFSPAKMHQPSSVSNTGGGMPQPTVPISDGETPNPPEIGWAWLENVWNSGTVGSVSFLEAEWKVPPKPTQAGATSGTLTQIYMFPGLQANTYILQPVLGYWSDGWRILVEDCCDASGNNFITGEPVIDVSPGDVIIGYVEGYNCNATTSVCANWIVGIGDETTNRSVSGITTRNNTDIYGASGGQVVGGALELYHIDSCAQLPPSLNVTFYNERVGLVDGTTTLMAKDMSWVNMVSNQSPNCSPNPSFVVDNYLSTITLAWSGIPACSPNCGLGTTCSVDNDCSSTLCPNGVCIPACAPNCSLGMACGVNNDCSLKSCSNGVCTWPPPPTVQASINLILDKGSAITLSWQNGNGEATAVFMAVRPTGYPAPVDGTVYLQNTVDPSKQGWQDSTFGQGDQIGTSGWYCVYNGLGSGLGGGAVQIDGLQPGMAYWIMAVTYNGYSINYPIYLTAAVSGNPVNHSLPLSTVPVPATPHTVLVVLASLLCGVGLLRIRKRGRGDPVTKVGLFFMTLALLNACGSSPFRGDADANTGSVLLDAAGACTWPSPLDAAGACLVLGVTSECAANQYGMSCGGAPHFTDAGDFDENYYQQPPDGCTSRIPRPDGWSLCCPCQ